VSRARREAEQILAAAATQAEAVRSSGDAERQREVALLKAEVDRLSKRRDAITAQLASLRDVVAGFGDDDAS
jgi:cell division protein FtsB